jgi:hypothetical protein
MKKRQLGELLYESCMETNKLRIAILRAVGRDPYAWPPSDYVLIAELARLTSVPADGGALAAANVTPTDEQESLPAAAAEHSR